MLDQVGGRVPAIVGVSTGSAEESLGLARHAQARGATGILAQAPEGSMVAIYRTIMARFTAGDREGARALFERLLPVLAFVKEHIDVSVQFFKRVLVAKGIFRTSVVREPILRFDDVQARIAVGLVHRVLELERSLA